MELNVTLIVVHELKMFRMNVEYKKKKSSQANAQYKLIELTMNKQPDKVTSSRRQR